MNCTTCQNYKAIENKPTETKETPSRIKVYTPSGASSSSKSTSDNSYKWVVKTDVFSILTGEFPLIGEYRFAQKFSVEASAGVTYSYLPNDFLDSNTDYGYSSSDNLMDNFCKIF